MSDLKKYVGFKLANDDFAVDIMVIEEIIRRINITPIPRSPDYVLGIVNLREKVIPIISLRKKLNMPVLNDDEDTRVIISSINNRRIGFVVDSVSEVLSINTNDIDATPCVKNSNENHLEGIARVGADMIVIVDVLNLFSQSEFLAIDALIE